ncbi:D-arabinono-1,4-lactone oxidase [Ktedonobacter robiniae]|uniref:FAD-binding oxidoreductase n=1 Tax=Ktedonobacter robiniae TaxID=2778365 RepID=A0ABQ3UXV4_9CHLR|nr:D-arabinono-1,4-lactone oxidase [Ktedonobacter robiniae]GHO57489.1 FAD-binding oxidoreductase [Ktedonobacter robiniae]
MRQIKPFQWKNWSGTVQCTPQVIASPDNIDALTKLVKAHNYQGHHIRVAGSGHSMVPLVPTSDVIISLQRIQGISAIDGEQHTATVMGGTILARLGEELLHYQLAQENLGDIVVQSIAGAISTGTHGTGIRFGNLSTQVVELTLITATGEQLVCSPDQQPEIFQAALVSLGTLGIIIKVKLRVVPAHYLHYQGRRMRLDDCLDNLEQYQQEYKHFGFYWYPHTPWVHAKFFQDTTATAPQMIQMSNRHLRNPTFRRLLYWSFSETCRHIPALCTPICGLLEKALIDVEKIDYSHRVLTFTPGSPLHEMEYALPAECARQAMRDIAQCIERNQFKVHGPVQCRFGRADDIWLSPAYQRETAYIAVHMYHAMPYRPFFAAVEDIFKHYQGRPHWGKFHTQQAEQLAQLYPRWQDFQRIRTNLDPNGIFLNSYLKQLLAQ